ncbi:MAG: tetratricopeptide repeat protein [Planctomycetes bacterium]|nr:tetratricopeptide repeat protein [Planctomycetota bacterium]
MQRYRVNYWLLFGFLAGSLLIVAVAFLLVHPWQVNRKASWFLERADQAFSENDLREAFNYQHLYVRYRKKEDDARIKLSHMAVDISQLDDATREDYGTAYRILDDTVRRTGDAELRRRLADMLMGFSPQQAIVHIQELLEDDPNNTELQALRVRALFLTKDFRRATELALGLIGYDKQSKEFDPKKATAADQPEIYALLATVLHEKRKTRELARQVIDRLVEVNPELFDAHLKRSTFLYQINETEEAGVALEKAYELAPTDFAVLQRKGRVALTEKDYDAAKEFFEKALELYPDKIEIYQLLAQTETRRNQIEEALTILDQGIARSDERRSLHLLIFKINLLFETKDFASVKKEIDALSKMKSVSTSALEPLVDYLRARVKWGEKKWAEAAKDLNRVRPLLFAFPNEQILAGFFLGRAYENLGKLDLARQAYVLVLQSRPKHSAALKGKKRVDRRIRPDEVVEDSNSINSVVKGMLARPEDQQDWEKVDQLIAKIAEEREITGVPLSLQRAQIFLQRQMFPEAKQLIQDAAKLEPEDVNVRMAAVKLLYMDPASGPAKALALLDKTVQQFGTTLQSRVLRAELLLSLGGDDVAEKLHALTEGIEEWSPGQQGQLFSSLGVAFQRLNLPADALQYWKNAVGAAPNNLPLRMRWFEIALQLRDEDAMGEAQQQILELVGDKNDASYILTEVKRRLLGFRLEQISREEVLEARGLLDTALQQRAEWSELHVLYGQLLIFLNEDIDLALQHLDDALKYGPANVNAVGLQVKLLSKRGRFEEAREAMNRLPQASRSRVLGSAEAEVLLATGDNDGAFEAAEKIATGQPEVAKTQKWFAKLAQQVGKLDSAAAAYQKAARLTPGDVDTWSQLLSIYATQKKSDEVLDVLRRAQLSLDAEFLPLIAAKSFELQGQWRNAEKIYLAAYSGRLEEVVVARRMADFYLLWTRADASNLQRAGKFINHILRASYEGKIPSDHAQALWARNLAARHLANTGRYQDSLKAQRLLAQSEVDGKLSIVDQTLQAKILASLKDPASQGKAIRLFTELQKNGHLQKKGTLVLAQLLQNANRWQRCEELMLDALGTYGADTQVWTTYISMLIDRGEYSKAERRIKRLKQLAPQSISYIRLLALLASKKGDQPLVRKTLAALLPENLKGALDADQLQAIRAVAQLATLCEDFELAEKLYQLYAQRLPKAAFELVQFQALYGDAEVAMEAMEKEFPNRRDGVLALSTQMLRKRRDEIGDRYDEQVNRMLATAIRDDPDSTGRLMFRAEILEIEQKYNQSAEAYDNLLRRDDLPNRVRAVAMNNLAFLLAMLGERLEEAEQLVDQSMETFGPIGDLLDTRALVRIASKKYDLAIEDLTLAVSVSRDPIKYYHLARAQLLAGDKKGALKSWEEAKNLGVEKEKLPLLEQPVYEEFETTIGQSGSA